MYIRGVCGSAIDQKIEGAWSLRTQEPDRHEGCEGKAHPQRENSQKGRKQFGCGSQIDPSLAQRWRTRLKPWTCFERRDAKRVVRVPCNVERRRLDMLRHPSSQQPVIDSRNRIVARLMQFILLVLKYHSFPGILLMVLHTERGGQMWISQMLISFSARTHRVCRPRCRRKPGRRRLPVR
jgi:hypothetical protein